MIKPTDLSAYVANILPQRATEAGVGVAHLLRKVDRRQNFSLEIVHCSH